MRRSGCALEEVGRPQRTANRTWGPQCRICEDLDSAKHLNKPEYGFVPKASREEPSSARTLLLAYGNLSPHRTNPILTPHPRTCELKSGCCFKLCLLAVCHRKIENMDDYPIFGLSQSGSHRMSTPSFLIHTHLTLSSC